MDDIIEVIHNEILENNLDINVAGQIALQLGEPLGIIDEPERRQHVPKNENYYEETIQSYIGDLFVQHFRMSRPTFEELLHLLANNRQLLQKVIPFEKKVLFTIWVLAKPESFLAAGDRFGLARSTAHNTFREIVAIFQQLIPQFIIWPRNHQESINAFRERSQGFPGVVGAIDGSHIPIKQPRHNPVDYYNRKEFHYIVLQAVCNHKMLFLDIFVGIPGRVHDARVFRLSDLYRRLTSARYPLLTPDLHILGDSAYPLMSNVLTPYRDNGHLNIAESNFNNKLSIVRSIIERAFGRLKGKFRRLKYLDIGNPDFGNEIIAAACVLS